MPLFVRNYQKPLPPTPNFRFPCHRQLIYKLHRSQFFITQKSPQNASFKFSSEELSSMDKEQSAEKSNSRGNKATRWAIFKRSLRRESRKMKLWGSVFKWKRLTNLQISFMDTFIFKFVSMLEALVLVLRLCFFLLCFGCHF